MSRSTKFISLAEHSPELLSEWHPTKNTDIRPQEISYGSAVKVWWKCAFGHEWQASPNGLRAVVAVPSVQSSNA